MPGAIKLWFNSPESLIPVVSIVDLADVSALIAEKTVGYPLSLKELRALSEKKSPAEQPE